MEYDGFERILLVGCVLWCYILGVFLGWQSAESKAANRGYFIDSGKYYTTQEDGSVENEPPVTEFKEK